ncbi:unnamed protein product [Calypogeia fissa]
MAMAIREFDGPAPCTRIRVYAADHGIGERINILAVSTSVRSEQVLILFISPAGTKWTCGGKLSFKQTGFA